MTMQLKDYWTKRKAREFYAIPGYQRINDLLQGGFIQKELHVIYAETGRGKTSFAVDMCFRWLMESNLKICFISLEEDIDVVQSRFTARLLAYGKQNISYAAIVKNDYDQRNNEWVTPYWEAWEDRLALLNVSTVTGGNIADLQMLRKNIGERIYDYDIFIIDHIHNVFSGSSNQDTVLAVANALKELTSQGATIIALAQMRKSENSKQPNDYGQRTFESIAGAKALSNFAVSILHLYYTERQTAENAIKAEKSAWDELQCIIRLEKTRFGRLGGSIMQYNPINCRFTEEPFDLNRYALCHSSPEKKSTV